MRYENVFHGTLDHRADKIIRKGFIESKKEFEWLGNGVYFFNEFDDAKCWAIRERNKPQNIGSIAAVIQAKTSVEEEYFYDFDVPDKMDSFILETQELAKALTYYYSGDFTREKVRCALCNWFAKKHNIRVYAYSFPKKINTNAAFFPYTVVQRQLCVRDKDCISEVHLCYKEEFFDAV